MTRAERRAHLARAKVKSKAILRRSFGIEPTPRQVGVQAAMHNTCPCWMCTEGGHSKPTLFSDLVKFHEVAA